MKYVGGKSKIAKDISIILNNELGGQRPFVSLFCGGCAIEGKIKADIKILNDVHPYLIAMWKELQDGWLPPDSLTKEEYYYVKEHKDKNPALTGFVGFGGSFGGKWFGGYAKTKGRNYCAESKRNVLKLLNELKDAQFICLDYRDVEIPENSVVYCDKPYESTTGYSTGNFDHNAFWEYARKISQTNTVFISEQQAPDDFECVWQKEVSRTLDVNSKNVKKIEKLFRLK